MDRVSQTSWKISQVGSGKAKLVNWQNSDHHDGGYSLQVRTQDCSNESNAVVIENITPFPTLANQLLKFGCWLKSPSGITTNPAIKIKVRIKYGNESNYYPEQTFDIASGSGFADWTKQQATFDLSAISGIKRDGAGTFKIIIVGDGELFFDSAFVRDGAISDDEPYLRDGSYYTTISTEEAFTEEENAAVHNSESTYGVKFGSVDVDINNYEDALQFARNYFSEYAVAKKSPEIALVNYVHDLLLPGQSVRLNGGDAAYLVDGVTPIVRVSETLNQNRVLESRLEMQFIKRDITEVLKDLKRKQSFIGLQSGGFTGSPGNSYITNDTISSVGVETVNDLSGNLVFVGGDGITLSESGNTITIDADAPTDVVESLNGLDGAVTLSAGTNITLTPVENNIEISAVALATDSTYGHIFASGVQQNSTFGNAQAFIMHSTNASMTLSFNTDTKVIFVANGRPDHSTLTVSAPSGSLGGSWNLAYEETGLFVAFDIGGGDFDVRRFL